MFYFVLMCLHFYHCTLLKKLNMIVLVLLHSKAYTLDRSIVYNGKQLRIKVLVTQIRLIRRWWESSL